MDYNNLPRFYSSYEPTTANNDYLERVYPTTFEPEIQKFYVDSFDYSECDYKNIKKNLKKQCIKNIKNQKSRKANMKSATKLVLDTLQSNPDFGMNMFLKPGVSTGGFVDDAIANAVTRSRARKIENFIQNEEERRDSVLNINNSPNVQTGVAGKGLLNAIQYADSQSGGYLTKNGKNLLGFRSKSRRKRSKSSKKKKRNIRSRARSR